MGRGARPQPDRHVPLLPRGDPGDAGARRRSDRDRRLGLGPRRRPAGVAYAATKAAVVNLTRALAIDHGPDGIRANCVCPGDTDTPLLRDELAQLGEEAAAGIAASGASRPLGRVAAPAEIAARDRLARIPDAGHVTGTTLVVDGGGLAGG